jgi:hypothetical protein
MLPDGSSIAAFARTSGAQGVTSLSSTRYTPSGGWSTAQPIEQASMMSADYGPILAAGSSDRVWMLWTQSANIFVQPFETASGWGPTTTLRTPNQAPSTVVLPSLISDGQNHALVLWLDMFPGDKVRLVSRAFDSTAWGPETIVTEIPYVPITYVAGSNSSGQFMVVWQQELNDMSVRMFARSFSMTASWSEITAISDEFLPTGEHSVAVDESGNAVAVWSQLDANSDRGIFANQFQVGAGWSKPTNIENKLDGDAHSPCVTIDAQGRAIAVWSVVQKPAGGTQIVANTFE